MRIKPLVVTEVKSKPCIITSKHRSILNISQVLQAQSMIAILSLYSIIIPLDLQNWEKV
jgi:hypothetical protein